MLRDRTRAVGLVFIGVMAVGLGAAVASDPARPGDYGGTVFALLMGAVAVWSLLAARRGVRPDQDGVLLRYMVRRRFVPWAEVAHFGLVERRNWFGERLTKPTLVLRSGDAMVVPGADKVSFLGRTPDEMRFEVLEELERLREGRG